MGSSSKRQTTMAKMARERRLQEKRERKQEKKEARKLAAAEGTAPEAGEYTVAADPELGENTEPALPAENDTPPAV